VGANVGVIVAVGVLVGVDVGVGVVSMKTRTDTPYQFVPSLKKENMLVEFCSVMEGASPSCHFTPKKLAEKDSDW